MKNEKSVNLQRGVALLRLLKLQLYHRAELGRLGRLAQLLLHLVAALNGLLENQNNQTKSNAINPIELPKSSGVTQ